ncbi:MAG: Ig domain-containing protein [Firmicutes bacterium]|nr:Ig domain-containing protein [Bacillota bacterium]
MAKAKPFTVPTVLFLLFAITFMGYMQLASAGEGTITAYGWSCCDTFGRGPVGLTIPDGEVTLIKEDRSVGFMSGGDFVVSTWYTVNDSSNSGLFTVDYQTGTYTTIGYTGIKELTSFTYDVTTKTAYVADVNKLYTIDLATAQVTEVGVITTGVIIGIAADNKGNLYALDNYDLEGNDLLYSVNKETGAGTAIGPIGFDANYAQDIAFNRANGKLYGALYSNTDGGGLYEINTATGKATLLKEYIIGIDALAIPYIDVKYDVAAAASPSAGGTVTGSGEYKGGAPVTVSATAAEGYEFVNWTEEGAVVSTELNYKIALLENRNLLANFKLKEAPAGGMVLNESSLSLAIGDTFQLGIAVFPDGTSAEDIVWSSSDEAVAAVDSAGLVSAVSAGQAVITAATKDGNFTAACTVTVTDPAGGMVLNESSLSLAGDTFQLVVTFLPGGATIEDIVWSSSDEAVATVDSAGLVSAVSAGQAVITAATKDGSFATTCTVTVTDPAGSMVLNESSLFLAAGDAFQLVVTTFPGGATIEDIVWSSSDEAVATVDSAGLVSALKAGQAVITAATKDGNFTAICAVRVTEAVSVLSLNPSTLYIPMGSSFQLTAAVVPGGATNQTILWRSSDEAVVTVGSEGLVSALKAGQAVVMATMLDSGFTDACVVTVTVPVSGISLNEFSISSLTVGSFFQLTATILPEEATDKDVIWSSSDEGVATVDSEGMVRAVGPGQVTISVTTVDGGLTSSCTVTVTVAEERQDTVPEVKVPAAGRGRQLPRTGTFPYVYTLPALTLLLIIGGYICLRSIKQI